MSRVLALPLSLLLSAWPAAAGASPVDASTLQGKVLFGYQGWFDCPRAGQGSWIHWSQGIPTPSTLTVDLYPDLSEFEAEDLCPADDFKIGGKQAYLFSSHNAAIVDAHFRWMEENGLDGVFAQRFGTETSWRKSSGETVLRNIMAASAKHGRAFALEYDISGLQEANVVQTLQLDWMYLVDQIKLTEHPNYLHHEGKPVLSIWGIGLNDAGHPPEDPAVAAAMIQWFQSDAPEKYRVYYVGGTPYHWRGLANDSRSDPKWKAVYRSMDAIQPWTVGRYVDAAGVDGWKKDVLIPDLAETKSGGQFYMPVVFPGFSWKNLNDGPENQIPRKGGTFFWRQAMQAKAAGASMLKIAMFDEVDEGTAMFKVTSKRSEAPDDGYWLTLDADGKDLPTDWYLRLAGEVTQVFHGLRPISDTIPIQPGDDVSALQAKHPRRAGGAKGMHWRMTPDGGLVFQGLPAGDRLRIWDMRGKIMGESPIRRGRADWDGRDAQGKRFKPGIYWVDPGGGGAKALCLGFGLR